MLRDELVELKSNLSQVNVEVTSLREDLDARDRKILYYKETARENSEELVETYKLLRNAKKQMDAEKDQQRQSFEAKESNAGKEADKIVEELEEHLEISIAQVEQIPELNKYELKL